MSWITPALAQLDSPCYHIRVNAKGSPTGTSIPVSTTPVLVAEVNTSRCSLSLVPENANNIRCGPSTGPYALVVSATVGVLIQGPQGNAASYAAFGRGATEAWQCIRAGSTDGQVSILEELP